MNIKKQLWAGLSGILAAAAGMSASATSLIQLDVQGLVDESAIIVVGTATDQQYAETASGLQTLTTFSVSDEVVGSGGGSVTVGVPGGIRTNGKYKVAETWPGAPRFLNNQEVLIFLSDEAGDGAYRVVGFSQGVVNVVETIEGKMVDLPGDDLGLMSLETAKADIRSAKANPRGKVKKVK